MTEMSKDQQDILGFLDFLEKFLDSDSGERSDRIGEKSFAYKGYLRKHSLVHTGEKQFAC